MKQKLQIIIVSVIFLMLGGCTKTSFYQDKVESFTEPQYEWGKVSNETLRVGSKTQW